ncbi:hypothetical protein B0H11DRAFT_2380359 [Mycena galericulata]|nr:hypothetical protein B0H11DRAFT_2380359 [Mycena galericulata]
MPEFYPRPDPPLDLSDRKVVAEYHRKLEADRRLAQLYGLTAGLCFSFDLTIPAPNPLPRARSPPRFPPKEPVSFYLDQSLQSGPDKHSQVWTAVTELAGARTTVVLKIIQPSMCMYPELNDVWDRNYEFPENLAHEEAWVYDRLATKQGLYIPYFFGLQTIITPSGEAAWVLVLEYIHGEDFIAYIRSPTRSFSDTCDLLRLSIDTLTEFMADGWCHNDANPRNIIVTGSPGARSVVFIDLYFTCRFSPEDLTVERRRRRRKLYCAIHEALKDQTGEIQRWAVQNIDLEVCDPIQLQRLQSGP